MLKKAYYQEMDVCWLIICLAI